MTDERQPELEAIGGRIIDSNRYMTIATIGDDGHPWATPVYFTPDGYTDFYWISSPETEHSKNIAERSEVGIVIFDSTVPIGGAEAVYIRARAAQVPHPTPEECAVAFRRRFEPVKDFTPEELREPAPFRLYRATAEQHWVLIRGSDPVWGRGTDSRLAISL